MENNYKSFRTRVTIFFSIAIFLLTIFVTAVPMGGTLNSLRESFSDLMTSSTKQLGANIDANFGWVEKTATLMFSVPGVYEFDPVTNSYTEYQKLQVENEIDDLIEQLGVMGNYADFGIIYSNDYHIGWISEKMSSQYMDGGMYEEFADSISDENTESGWSFGHKGNYDKFYYVKRLNENAILMISFYTAELDDDFDITAKINNEVTLYLIDENNNVLYSNDDIYVGMKLDGNMASLISKDSDATKYNDKYLVTTSFCKNGWRLVCSIPQDIISSKMVHMRNFNLISAGIICLGFILLSNMIYYLLSRPIEGMMTSLNRQANYDSLSNVFNKAAFESEASKRIDRMKSGDCMGFLMLDMDNFKQINDKLGHAYGDQVIIRVGKLLRHLYDKETIIGRLGGDEFALFTECIDVGKDEVISAVREQMEHVLEEFLLEFELEREQCGVTLSAGVYVTEKKDAGFKELYEKADKELYISKQAGKSQYNLSEG